MTATMHRSGASLPSFDRPITSVGVQESRINSAAPSSTLFEATAVPQMPRSSRKKRSSNEKENAVANASIPLPSREVMEAAKRALVNGESQPPSKKRKTSQANSRASIASTAPNAPNAPNATVKKARLSTSNLGGNLDVEVTLDDGVTLTARELLASRWLGTRALRDLSEKFNFQITKGKFSNAEDQAIRAQVESYMRQESIPDRVLFYARIFKRSRKARTDQNEGHFWYGLAQCLPGRPLENIYTHTKRMYAPHARAGPWTSAEDRLLTQAVDDLGSAWTQVAVRVGRPDFDCKDRWRDFGGSITREQSDESVEKKRKRTPRLDWTPAETLQLAKCVVEQRARAEQPIVWSEVAATFGSAQRSAKRCMTKWENLQASGHAQALLQQAELGPNAKLIKRVRGQRWRPDHTYKLLRALKKSKAESADAVDWLALKLEGEPSLSPDRLRRRWRRIEGQVAAAAPKRPFRKMIKANLKQMKAAGLDKAKNEAQQGHTQPPIYLSKETIDDSDEE